VDDLAVPLLERWRPGARALLSLTLEDAVRPGSLEFNEVVCLFQRVADNQITTEVAEEVILERQQVTVSHCRVVDPQKGRQMETLPKQGKDVLALRQLLLTRE